MTKSWESGSELGISALLPGRRKGAPPRGIHRVRGWDECPAVDGCDPPLTAGGSSGHWLGWSISILSSSLRSHCSQLNCSGYLLLERAGGFFQTKSTPAAAIAACVHGRTAAIFLLSHVRHSWSLCQLVHA